MLDCAAGPSVGVPDPPAACAQLIARRYSLLAPVVSDSTCAGDSSDTMELSGTFLGVDIVRGYDQCYGGTTGAWQELLGVPARASVDFSGDRYSAAAVRIAGATPAERRIMRRALAHVPTSLPVDRIVFGWQGRRRGFSLVVGADGVRVPAFERRWLASVVVEDLARRLRGAGLPVWWVGVGTNLNDTWPFLNDRVPRRNAGATLTLTRAIRQRAIDAGWIVRAVRGWQVGPGAVALTLRLTERQFLDGLADWTHTLLADASDLDDGYAAQLVIEAPDGTPVFVQSNRSRTGGYLNRGGAGLRLGFGTAPPPAGLTGPTRLELTFSRTTASGPETVHAVLDCAGGTSIGVADPSAACAGLIADRYVLLAPVPADLLCDTLVAGGITVQGDARRRRPRTRLHPLRRDDRPTLAGARRTHQLTHAKTTTAPSPRARRPYRLRGQIAAGKQMLKMRGCATAHVRGRTRMERRAMCSRRPVHDTRASAGRRLGPLGRGVLHFYR